MAEAPGEKRPWKRVVELVLLLFLFPPVGLWKLWQDPALSRSNKWRILIYLFVLPALVYVTVSLSMTSRLLQKMMP